MTSSTPISGFAKYAWFTLFYNIVVILWGVFLRASYSGDGCGQHWLTCGGEAIPSAPQLKTLIEFSHRVTTALAGIVVVVLAAWAIISWAKRRFPKGEREWKFALLSLVFIITEGAIGAGLVLTGNTAANWTPTRPLWTIGHLINTFILVAFLSLTAWSASGGKLRLRKIDTRVKLVLVISLAAIIFSAISGSMAALTNMLFPSVSVAEGLAKDFAESSHYLLRLRILHPISSIVTGVLLFFVAGWMKKVFAEEKNVQRWAGYLAILVLVQIVFGGATLLMLAPIVMQLGHLLLADLLWIAFVLMSASAVFERPDLPIPDIGSPEPAAKS
jgi:heme A synthase